MAMIIMMIMLYLKVFCVTGVRVGSLSDRRNLHGCRLQRRRRCRVDLVLLVAVDLLDFLFNEWWDDGDSYERLDDGVSYG